ncbi:MAG: Cytidylate kinase [Anaerolineae bacterium]|nr:Cytidylate kinase [Anaerolineae bacterium]
MSKPSTIAIDGFAASGKSTVAALLAEQLGYLYFDTGVMYRAVTWAVLDRGVDPADVAGVSQLAEQISITVTADGPADGRQATVRVDGRDVTWDIRQPQVDALVSRLSSYPRVRTALTNQQRRIAAAGSMVMAGRDIGTVVLPDADLKVFLLASPEERARRRYRQSLEQNRPADFDQILAAIIQRDALDRDNPVSPTHPAADAIIIDTDNLTIAQVVEQLKHLVETSCNEHA